MCGDGVVVHDTPVVLGDDEDGDEAGDAGETGHEDGE